MKSPRLSTRRKFLRSSIFAGAVGTALAHRMPGTAEKKTARVTLTAGEDNADNIYRALLPFREELSSAIGDRRVVLKPNNVMIDNQLSATHSLCLEGALEFLKSIGKATNVVIAESAASGSTMAAFENYGYFDLARRYRVKLVDLDGEEFERVYVFDQRDFKPHPVRMSKLLLDQKQNFIISVAKLKTHDRVVATLSLKNIVFGAPIKDVGFTWSSDRKPGSKTDKHLPHGSGFRAINYNIFNLAPILHPSFSIIDGYRGMEGDGPLQGTPVEHRVALAGRDWLAADRIALELMGIGFEKVGYLNYCADAGMGVADLKKIEVLGERPSDHIVTYRLNKNVGKQLIWQKPAQVS